ncbi:MAG: DUF933 domain-containing protein [Candidatus Margulisbacteria bacterium]|nr:DUF933 domain-containing protein [Candidatus Margulisiibacteriota bacterium]
MVILYHRAKRELLDLVRQEGKEYVMQNGDVVLFKFNNLALENNTSNL